MKKSLLLSLLWFVVLLVVVWLLILNKDDSWSVEWLWDPVLNWIWMVNEVSSYSIYIKSRWEFMWEDVYVYDENGNLVLSLDDEKLPQSFFVLYGNYLVLDSGTSASQREMLVYDIPSWKIIYKTDYYPWEDWLILNGDNINFYKEIDQSLYWNYTLPNCENEYNNGYVERYEYTIWGVQANDLRDIQCAYFE